MKKVLLTGAGGQLGLALQASVPQNIELCALTHNQLDITQEYDVAKVVATYAPDWVVNAAAYNHVDQAQDDSRQAYAVNFEGVKHLAQAARSVHSAMIHISTDYVFSGTSSCPYQESDITKPLNVYGQSKLAGERALEKMHNQCLIIRTSSLFDCGENNFVGRLLMQAKKRSTLRVIDDLVSCPTPVSALAQVIWQAVRQHKDHLALPWGIWHFAGGPACSRFAWAQEVVTLAQKYGLLRRDVRVEPVSFVESSIAKRPHYSVLDCQKLGSALGVEMPNWRKFIDKDFASRSLA